MLGFSKVPVFCVTLYICQNQVIQRINAWPRSDSDAVNKEVDSLEREVHITKELSARKQDCVLPILDFPLEGEYV